MGSSDQQKNRVNQNHIQISVNTHGGRGQPQEHSNNTAYVNGVAPKRPNFRHHGAKNNLIMSPSHQRTIENNNNGNTVMMDNTMAIPASSTPPTLLFERLVSEEVQELKSYARMIESQSRRLAELDRIHNDLENRLERETQERMDLEATLEQHERGWADKCETLTKERDQLKALVQTEKTTNERLVNLVRRKDIEIRKMIQRKFERDKQPHGHHRDHSRGSTSGTGSSHSSLNNNDRGSSIRPAAAERYKGSVKNRSPHEYLSCRSNDQSIREREVTEVLTDFFGHI